MDRLSRSCGASRSNSGAMTVMDDGLCQKRVGGRRERSRLRVYASRATPKGHRGGDEMLVIRINIDQRPVLSEASSVEVANVPKSSNTGPDTPSLLPKAAITVPMSPVFPQCPAVEMS